MASSMMAKASPALLQPKQDDSSAALLRSASSSCKAFGSRCSGAGRVACSLEDMAKKVSDAGRSLAVATVATTMLIAGSASANPGRLTYEEIQGKTYLEVKGSGTANQCPIIAGGSDGFAFKPGSYNVKKMCLEPTSFTVKKESPFKGESESFVDTKLMTRLTYTLDEIEGPLVAGSDGTLKFEEKDGIDYAAVTVQLPGGERVPFLFTIKQLVASGKPEALSGEFLVPSYRGSSFLDPKGRGGSTGYDNAVALPAGGRGDLEELSKENNKDNSALIGKITIQVAKSNTETGEIAGVFESVQPSDTDLGSKAPKDVKIQGIWYAQLE